MKNILYSNTFFLSGPQGDNTIVPDMAAAQTGELGGILGGVGGRPGLGGPGGLGGTTPGGRTFIFCLFIIWGNGKEFLGRDISCLKKVLT